MDTNIVMSRFLSFDESRSDPSYRWREVERGRRRTSTSRVSPIPVRSVETADPSSVFVADAGQRLQMWDC